MKTIRKEDIDQLLRCFMDGQTTVEEEEELTRYFATHDVPPEWSDYREMFRFFAEGMPADSRPDTTVKEKHALGPRMARLAWWAAAAAAIVVVAVLWTGRETQATPDTLTAAVKDSVRIETKTAADSLTQPANDRRDRQSYREYRQMMRAPKVYLAKKDTDNSFTDDEDIIRPVAPEIDKEVERHLHEIEMAQEAMFDENEMTQLANDIILSLMEDELEDDTEETTEVY